MKLFDTHAHLTDPRFDTDRGEVIQRLLDAGVERLILMGDPCGDPPDAHAALALAKEHDFMRVGVGVHPHNAIGYDEAKEAELRQLLDSPLCACLGEIGLDYHYDLSPRNVQREAFERQLDIALELDMPVSLHIREAHGETMEALNMRYRRGRLPRGVMHCYTGSWESAKVYLKLGYYISLSGAVTFKNASKLVEVARNVPENKLLVETDCPYMSPVPMRGKRNEPAFVEYTLCRIAEIRGVPADELAEAAFSNVLRIFK